MKKLTIGLGLLFSLNAFAAICPDIEGTYTCQKGSHVSVKEIARTADGYIIVSDGMEYEYRVDGNTYEVPSTDSMTDGKVKASCHDNKFVVDFNASILYDGTIIAKQVSKTEYSKKGDNLIFAQKIKMKGLPLPALNFECIRNTILN